MHAPPTPRTARTRPLRVSIVGSSTASFVVPRTTAGGGNYGEQLEALLWAEGRPVRVINRHGWLRRIDELYAEAEERVMQHDPDVVVLDVGWVECQPLVLPLGLLRWTFSWRPSLHPAALAWRQRVRGPLKAAHTRWGPALIRRGLPVPSRLSERRFVAELERFVELVHRRHRALVLLVNVPPTRDDFDDALPGIQERARRYSALIDDVVRRTGRDDVRLIDARAMVTEAGVDAVLPDGIHCNAEGHARLAERIATEIRAWDVATLDGNHHHPNRGRQGVEGGHP